MKIKLVTIPTLLPLSTLFCGSVAVVSALVLAAAISAPARTGLTFPTSRGARPGAKPTESGLSGSRRLAYIWKPTAWGL